MKTNDYWPDGTPRLSWVQRRALLFLFLVIAGPPFLLGAVLMLLLVKVLA